MAIYTCYDMIRDCALGNAQGWKFFVDEYVPVIRALSRHYYPDRPVGAGLEERVLRSLRGPDGGLFAGMKPLPEREFVAELRLRVLAAMEAETPSEAPRATLGLETLSAALKPLSATERQIVWLETMRYGPEETSSMMNTFPETVEKIRENAAELLRGQIDTWSRDLVAANGPALRAAVAAARTEPCQPIKTFLDWLDGKLTWYSREDIERHLIDCWHCIDLFCRVREVQGLLRRRKPLTPEIAAPYYKVLEIPAEKPPLWKRVLRNR